MKITMYIPHNLDLDGLLEKNPPKFKYKKDHLIYIIGLIYETPFNKPKKCIDGWVPISVQLVQNIGARAFKYYKEWLIQNKILECDNQYIKGKKCRRYRFPPQYRAHSKEVSLTDFFVRRKLYQVRKNYQPSKKKLNHLGKWFNPNIQIDEKGAKAYLNKEYEKRINQSDHTAFEKLYHWNMSVTKVKNGDFYFHQDTTAGRVHTLFTNMKSGIRKFITYDQTPLVAYDFANSQPMLSTLLLEPGFWKIEPNQNQKQIDLNVEPRDIFEVFSYKSLSNKGISKELDNLLKRNSKSKYSSGVILAKLPQLIDKEDVIKFKSQVIGGKFYDDFAKEAFERGFIDSVDDKKKIKSAIFQVLFTDNRYTGIDNRKEKRESYLKALFTEIYPNVDEVYRWIKSARKQLLPVLLQAIEVDLVINRITKRIAKEKPDLPLFTIHDSVVTTKGNEDYIKEIILEEAKKMLGFQPKLKKEVWSNDS